MVTSYLGNVGFSSSPQSLLTFGSKASAPTRPFPFRWCHGLSNRVRARSAPEAPSLSLAWTPVAVTSDRHVVDARLPLRFVIAFLALQMEPQQQMATAPASCLGVGWKAARSKNLIPSHKHFHVQLQCVMVPTARNRTAPRCTLVRRSRRCGPQSDMIRLVWSVLHLHIKQLRHGPPPQGHFTAPTFPRRAAYQECCSRICTSCLTFRAGRFR